MSADPSEHAIRDRRPLALITGATSGIGKALAHCFAQGGHDVVLVARDEEALTRVASEIGARHGGAAYRVAGDLSHPETPRKIAEALRQQGLAVDYLVNNAGFGVHGAFTTTALASELAMVNLQIGAMLSLTKDFLPGMLQRGKGGILNVASVYTFSPVAFQSVYGACKAFMYAFSEALYSEIAGSGVKMSVLCPGVTQTEFRKRAGVKEKRPGSGMTAEAVAALGYAALMRGQRLCVPGMANKIFVFFARHLPAGAIASVLRTINRFRGVGGQHHS